MWSIRSRIFLASVAVLAASCAPVVPDVAFTQTEFEEFTVYQYVPQNPTGIVYLFHGSGGSAEVVLHIEIIDLINELVARGYGFVATESTLRTGNKRWNVSDGSIVTNPDLARLVRLHDSLIADTPVLSTTPIFGIGMSNGARMVTLFGQSFEDAGYPVAAIASVSGQIANPVVNRGGLTVPTFFQYSENDQIVDNDRFIAGYEATVNAGTVAVLYEKPEEALLPVRFTRIPAIDGAEAEAIYDQLLATGVWDSNGDRVVVIDEAIEMLAPLQYPPSFGATQRQVRSQVAAMLSLHQLTALFKVQLVDFFDNSLS